MRIFADMIEFGYADRHFVKKFGLFEAKDMVFDFLATNKHPFIFDTFQLAEFFQFENRKPLFDMVKHINQHYSETKIAKKSGGYRTINIPDTELSLVQYMIAHHIINCFAHSKYATAYSKGASLYKNASPHTGKKYLLKMDIEDFFGSISFEMVLSTVFNTTRFPKQIGVMLTDLCCKDGRLPQGACTSPGLSNLVMCRFDDIMGAWCEKNGLSYTRYSDDITISGNVPLYKAYEKTKSLLESMGFEVNRKKTHFITNASSQRVTGLTVNEKVSVPREYKRKLRQELYYVIKHGYSDAIKTCRMYNYVNEYSGIDEYSYYMNLVGRINYVLQIEPDNNFFREMRRKIEEVPCGYSARIF